MSAPPQAIFFIMNIIVWNCKGARKPSFQSHVRELVRSHNTMLLDKRDKNEKVMSEVPIIPMSAIYTILKK